MPFLKDRNPIFTVVGLTRIFRSFSAFTVVGQFEAVFGGFAHKPGTTYGTAFVGVSERFISGYKAPNVCDLIAASLFPDSELQS